MINRHRVHVHEMKLLLYCISGITRGNGVVGSILALFRTRDSGRENMNTR